VDEPIGAEVAGEHAIPEIAAHQAPVESSQCRGTAWQGFSRSLYVRQMLCSLTLGMAGGVRDPQHANRYGMALMGRWLDRAYDADETPMGESVSSTGTQLTRSGRRHRRQDGAGRSGVG
jgi:hypothetical protein